MKEKLFWLVFACAIVAIFVISKDGFYRYPCMDPQNWTAPECQPPICTATKQCPQDLLGATNG
jgi:hypothetical protein